MSLRSRRVEEEAVLPDGRQVLVRVGVPEDPYIARRDLDTVSVELVHEERVLAAINTVLDADQVGEAVELAREVAAGLEAGELEPTAAAIGPLAERTRQAG